MTRRPDVPPDLPMPRGPRRTLAALDAVERRRILGALATAADAARSRRQYRLADAWRELGDLVTSGTGHEPGATDPGPENGARP